MVGFDRAHQSIGMRGAHLVVDVQTIRAAANGIHFGTQLVEYFGSNVISGAMGCIYDYFQAL